MRNRIAQTFGVVKTIAIGGLFFLLPLVVVLALLAQFIQLVHSVAGKIGVYLPVHTATGYAVLFGVALAALLLICFLAGIVARRSFGLRVVNFVERYLAMLFPRYTIFKEQLHGNLGVALNATKLQPVLVRVHDLQRIGLEIERGEDGLVTVYLPGAPDPWTGTVAIVTAEQVQPLKADFGRTMGTFEKLGRDTQTVLRDGLAPK
jgi:uncharacterized membrane protein